MKLKMLANNSTEEQDFRKKVEDIVSTFIRPYLNTHQGGIIIREIHGRDVGFVLTGHCSGCPSSQITMEEVVDKVLRDKLGQDLGRVYLINETDEDVLAFAKNLLQKSKKI